MKIPVSRKEITLYPDPSRVITRFFMPGEPDRARSIIEHVVALEEERAGELLDEVLRRFSPRHRNISKVFEAHYERVRELIDASSEMPNRLAKEKRLLIGAYFTREYSIEAAAFYNPSIVEDPYQGNLLPGQMRVILSFRGTGENHISSIVFRSAVLDENNDIEIETPGNLVDVPEVVKRYQYRKRQFLEKLEEMHIQKDVVQEIMNRLGERFSYRELQNSIAETRGSRQVGYTAQKVIDALQWLASSHYEVSFSLDTALSDRVLFPVSETENNGIEDARFVRFTDDDGSVRYYATYTAYNGFTILPKLLVTEDFYEFKVLPLHGRYAQNKGMSLFSRKIHGRYAMTSRCDGVNLFLMLSDDVHYWTEATEILGPKYPWEFVQIGNGGSPIETPEGWLLLTHGVGAVRTYGLGVTLLDLEDPTRVIGRLPEPLLLPTEEEREGYVPNVVYTCGALVHAGELVIPYGISDYATCMATVPLEPLLAEIKRAGD
jgi:predicted GH43/DUF377 family glycosyl hydrolase